MIDRTKMTGRALCTALAWAGPAFAARHADSGSSRAALVELYTSEGCSNHDAVARRWIGPIALDGDRATFDQVVTIPQWSSGRVGLVALVQDAVTAEVLQAVDTGVCKPG